MGDADIIQAQGNLGHAVHGPIDLNNNNQNATVFTSERLTMIIDILMNRKEGLIRRRAAEEFRISVTRNYRQSSESQIVEVVYKTLKKSKEDQVVLEQVLWAVTNLSCENVPIVHALLSKGVVKLLAKHAKSLVSQSVRDQAIWSLSNFAADCEQCRIAVRKTKVTDYIVDILKEPSVLSNKQRSLYTWALRNIFRATRSQLTVDNKKLLLDVLVRLMKLPEPRDAVYEALTTLQEWITQDTSESTASIIVCHNEIMQHLLYIFSHGEDDQAIAAVKVMGNIAFAGDNFIERIVSIGYIEIAEERLRYSAKPLQSEIYWSLSNIAGSHIKPYIDEVLSRPDLWNMMIQSSYDYDTKCRREALFCVLNVTSFMKDGLREETYREFFGRLLIDTIEGFTHENGTQMLSVVQAYIYHVYENLSKRCPLTISLIQEDELAHAVLRRFRWCEWMESKGNLTFDAKGLLEDIHRACSLILELINKMRKEPDTRQKIILPPPSRYRDPYGLD